MADTKEGKLTQLVVMVWGILFGIIFAVLFGVLFVLHLHLDKIERNQLQNEIYSAEVKAAECVE